MPDQKYWESLFNASQFLLDLNFPLELGRVAEFGCGFGTFTMPLSKRVSEFIIAADLDYGMLRQTRDRALKAGAENVHPVQSNFLTGFGLKDQSVDGVLIAHLLHGTFDENLALLREAARILHKLGKLAVIHWRCDVETPRGPPLEFRLSAEEAIELCSKAGFDKSSAFPKMLGDYHWGFVIELS